MKSELLRRIRFHAAGQVQTRADNPLLLLGRMASWQVRSVPVLEPVREIAR